MVLDGILSILEPATSTFRRLGTTMGFIFGVMTGLQPTMEDAVFLAESFKMPQI